MRKNYVKPTIEVVEMECSKMLCYSEKPHERVYIDQGDFDGCLPAIIMFVVATFSIGAGIFYCM